MKYILLIALLFLACGENTEQAELEPDTDKFFDVYKTFILAVNSDSIEQYDRSTLLDSALRQHGMTLAQFDTTMSFLEKHPKIFLGKMEGFDSEIRREMNKRQQ